MAYRARIAGLLVAALTAGCAATTGAGSQPAAGSPVSASARSSNAASTSGRCVLDEVVKSPFDFEPAKSPQELAHWSDVVLVGRLDAIVDGPVEYPRPGVPFGTIVFVVDVDEVIHGATGLVHGGVAYVQAPAYQSLSADDVAGYHPGDRILAFASEVTNFRNAEDPGAGRPAGAPLLYPLPEGLWAQCGGSDVALVERPQWGSIDTIDEIVRALRGG